MTDDIRAALRALATDDAPTVRPAATVDDAVTALDDVRTAAQFVDDGGLARLRRAVDAADPPTARRGRRALDAFERCRRAAADHFHSGRGTVLSTGHQGLRE